MTNQPLILVVNDDGFEAKGLEAMVEAAKNFGKVVVVVPDGPRSGMGHAITMNVPLRINLYKKEFDIGYYRTNGTPVDCVKLAQRVLLKGEKIDLVLSGINHGSNSSCSLIYSGTMAAAIEASFEDIKAVGISLLDYAPNADFTTAIHYAKIIIDKVLHHEMPPHVCLNVNVPKVKIDEVQGIKIVRQTKGYWHEDLEEHTDSFGRKYYWLSGHLVDQDQGEDTCEWALKNHYVSVQPVQTDMTAHHFINTLKFIEK
ncbi:MAG: 5'/3'-nucleotidase SurE [Bacteroidales bacterium]